MKSNLVTSLLKKLRLNTSLIDSYRSLSLLPFIAKHLNALFSTRYHYFFHRRTNWTLTSQVSEVAIQLRLHYSVTDVLRIVKADSKSSVLILLDLSAAFFLSTLSSLGITGIPLHWFQSYLTGRSFRVAWGGEVSKEYQLVTGVPQGSILGPVLFYIYTTPLGPTI